MNTGDSNAKRQLQALDGKVVTMRETIWREDVNGDPWGVEVVEDPPAMFQCPAAWRDDEDL